MQAVKIVNYNFHQHPTRSLKRGAADIADSLLHHTDHPDIADSYIIELDINSTLVASAGMWESSCLSTIVCRQHVMQFRIFTWDPLF